MHFVAMLAFVMPIPMSYDIGLTALSLVVAIVVTGVGFHVISRRSASPLRLVLSGMFMGLGIVAMHYTGMAAMRGHADLSYDHLFVALSVVIAIGASIAALWLAFRTTQLLHKLGAAVVMGLAISGMHYTAMHAAIFAAHGPVTGTQGQANLEPDQPGAGGRRHHVRHSRLRIDRLPVRPAVCGAGREGGADAAAERGAVSHALPRYAAAAAFARSARLHRSGERCLACASWLCARGGDRTPAHGFHDRGREGATRRRPTGRSCARAERSGTWNTAW